LVLCIVGGALNFCLFAAPEPVSQTRNVGSIKAMFASRAQAKATKNHVQLADNVENSSSKHFCCFSVIVRTLVPVVTIILLLLIFTVIVIV